MERGRVRSCKHQGQHVLISTSLLFFASLYPGSSSAQSTFDPALSTTALHLGRTPTVSASTMSTPASLSRTNTRRSMTTHFMTSSTPNTTTSSTTSIDSPDQPAGLFPITDSADVDRQRKESVFNYYFLFLAAFGVLIVVGLWWIHRRRKRRKEQMRLSGHNALARDLDGWVNTRRWMHGAWRYNQPAFVRREEGLDEHGEAPPPYQPKSEATVAQGDIAAAQDATAGLTIPLRTLSRDEIERSRPPGYEEVANGPSTARPDTATTRTAHPNTADRHPNSSTRDLLRIPTSQSISEHNP